MHVSRIGGFRGQTLRTSVFWTFYLIFLRCKFNLVQIDTLILSSKFRSVFKGFKGWLITM